MGRNYSLDGSRLEGGPGLDSGLKILEEVRSETGLPVLTDVHTPEQATLAGEVVQKKRRRRLTQ